MLFDAHAHISNQTTNIIFRPDYDIKTFIHEMDYHNITKSLIMVNPMFELMRCPTDVHHKVTVQDTIHKGILRLFCTHCNKVIYEGTDPIRKYNIELLEETNKYPNRFFYMIYLLLSNSTISSEVEFYEKNYPTQFIGYKLHPRLSFRKLDEITAFPSRRPLIIHTGVDFPPTSTNCNFLKKYRGNIILAHAGRFAPELLNLAATYPNIYIDAAPSSLMYKGRITDLIEPYNKKILTPSDIYKYLIETIGEDKVLFGSDVPWGNYNDEISILNSVDLPQSTYDKITYLNLIKALSFE